MTATSSPIFTDSPDKGHQRSVNTLPILAVSALGLVLGLIGLLLRRDDMWPVDVVTLTDSALGPLLNLSANLQDLAHHDNWPEDLYENESSVEADEHLGEFDEDLIFPMEINGAASREESPLSIGMQIPSV